MTRKQIQAIDKKMRIDTILKGSRRYH